MQELTSFELQKLITVNQFFSKILLSPLARLTLRALIDYYNHNTGKMYPSQVRLAADVGSFRQKINGAIKELKKTGLIISAGQSGQNNTYFFTAKFFVLIHDDKNNLSATESNIIPLGADCNLSPNSDRIMSPNSDRTCHQIGTVINNKKINIKKGKFLKNFKNGSEAEPKKIWADPYKNQQWQADVLKQKKIDEIKKADNDALFLKLRADRQTADNPQDFSKSQAVDWLVARYKLAQKMHLPAGDIMPMLCQKFALAENGTDVKKCLKN